MTSSHYLADLSWPEVEEHARAGGVLAVPVGSTEQHGPHLPLSTDSDIAVGLCERLAAARADVLIAPTVAYGSSGEHAGFAGTLSIGQSVTEQLLIELARSAGETFSRVLLVSAHGGNAAPVARAVAQVRAEGRDVCVYAPHWPGDPHAGRPETSLLLALRPGTVRMTRVEAGDDRPLDEILTTLRSHGVRAVSPNGVLGDPRGADADEGLALLDSLSAELIDHVSRWLTPVASSRA